MNMVLEKNEDVLKIIRDQKLFNCGIIVSSRPHRTREIKLYFPTVVSVVGFDNRGAERLVSNVFSDKNKIKQVMKFEPSDSHEDLMIQKCPILLSFLCWLVAEWEIDLSDVTIMLGDIYYRLVRCLYKKFTIKKGIEFKMSDFDHVMKSVGHLALMSLMSNNPLLQLNEVLRVVGQFAFEYGLFAGHEDFRLFGDPSADIYVTYAHRSLEEFFGSFGFIQALDDGKSVDDILGSDCEEPIFMVNPLVLRFCLWFLCQSFHLPRRRTCYDKLTSYVAKRIDSTVFDPHETRSMFPAIDMISADPWNDLKNTFFHDILTKCKHITILHLQTNKLDWNY